MEEMWRQRGAFALMILHTVSMGIVLFGPYLTNRIGVLIFLVGYNITIITGWYLFGGCWLTMLEQKLQGNTDTYADGSEKSYVTIFLQETLGWDERVGYYLITFIPVINSGVALSKIYLQYTKLAILSQYSNAIVMV